MNAVITTGGRVDAAYAAEAGTPIKALAQIRGMTMLARTIAALRGCGIARIAVVGEPPVHNAVSGTVDAMIEAARSGAENIARALRAWDGDDAVLYLTSDMPYIDVPSLLDFIERTPPGVLAMPLAEHTTFVRRFAGAPPFGIVLGGERVVNGGAFYIPPGAARRLTAVAAQFFNARKAPWRMAAIAGPALLLRFAMRRLRITDVETRAGEVLGIRVVAVRNAAPELAYDADTVDEFRYARDHW